MNEKGDRKCVHGRHAGTGRGPSSYWMQNPETVFDSLALKPGERFMDMGCGPGDYAMEASRRVGNSGVVYALDRTQTIIDALKTEAQRQGLENLRAVAADITRPLPVEDHCMDVCLIATVLHIPAVRKQVDIVFSEACRILKPGGRLAVIECKKEDMPFGPPEYMRLSPADIEHTVPKQCLKKLIVTDLGYNYMIQFSVCGSNEGTPE